MLDLTTKNRNYISYNFLLFLLFVSSFTFIACSPSNKVEERDRKQAIDKKDEALFLYINPTIEPELRGTDRTQKIMSLLDQSLSIDSTYISAYSLKAQILNDERSYIEAIDVLNKAFRYEKFITSNREYVVLGLYLMKGILFEKLDSIKYAQDNYRKAILQMDLVLQKDSSNFNALLNRDYLEIFISDEDAALEKMNQLQKKDLTKEEHRQVIFLIDMLKSLGRTGIVETAKVY